MRSDSMIRVLSSVELALPAGLRAGSAAAQRTRRIETGAPSARIVIEVESLRSTASASGRRQASGMERPWLRANGGRFTMRTSGRISVLAAALAAACVWLSPIPASAWNGGGHYWAAEAAAQVFGAGRDPRYPAYRPCRLPGESYYRVWPAHGDMVLTYEDICREPRYGIPIMPELGLVAQWHNAAEDCIDEECGSDYVEDRYLWDWLREGAQTRRRSHRNDAPPLLVLRGGSPRVPE